MIRTDAPKTPQVAAPKAKSAAAVKPATVHNGQKSPVDSVSVSSDKPTSSGSAAQVIKGLVSGFADTFHGESAPNLPKPQDVSQGSDIQTAGGTSMQQKTVQGGLDLISKSPTGRNLIEQADKFGVRIAITKDSDFADYVRGLGPDGTVRINPAALGGDEQAAGVLAHELGHALVDKKGALKRIQALPDNLGTLSNEIIAESLASAVAKEAGFSRGESAVTDKNGQLRTPAGGFDNILTNQFYLDYYKIDKSQISKADYAKVYDTVTTESINLINDLGGTPPDRYFEHTQKHQGFWERRPRYEWTGPNPGVD